MKKAILPIFMVLACSILFYFSQKEQPQGQNEQHALLANTQQPTQSSEQLTTTQATSAPVETPQKQALAGTAKRKNRVATKPEMVLNQPLYAEAESKDEEENEEAEEARERQKKQSHAEFLKREFEMTKDPVTGKVPRFAAREALEAAKKAPEFLLPVNARGLGVNGKEALPTVTTTARGPFNFGGRVRQVGIDRRDNNILIAGGASGLIKRSINGGSSWTIVHPADQINSFNCIVQHPHRDSGNIWYVGMGEPNSGSGQNGNGLLKSINNGQDWFSLTSTQNPVEAFTSPFQSVSKIAIDSTTGTVYAAIAHQLQVSQDTGATWTQILGNALQSQNYSDIIRTSNGTFYAAIHGQGIWKSTTANPIQTANWTKIAGPSSSKALATDFDRIVLASSPDNPNWVYALYTAAEMTCTNNGKSTVRLERYDAVANTWVDFSDKISNCAGISGTKVINPQDGYNLAIAVKPDNANLVYLGGTEIYRFNATTNAYDFIGGDQGSPSGTNLHVDVHSLYFSDNTTLWSTNDGGMHKTNVTGSIAAAPQGFTWDRKTTDFNSYQFYRADISPTTGSGFVGGGAQDNANTILPNGTTNGIELGGADGAQHAIISEAGSANFNILTSTQDGDMVRRTQAGQAGEAGYLTPTNQKGEFVTYFLLDKDNRNYLYFPSFNAYNANAMSPTPKGTGRRLFRSRTASTLTSGAITSNSNTGYEELTGFQSAAGTIIKTMASSYNTSFSGAEYTASNANRKLYIATDNALFRLNDPAFCPANTVPTTLTAPGTGTISDIAVNPYNDSELLLTYSNYTTVSIYHSTDAGASWTAVEGDAAAAAGKASVRSALIVRSGTQTLYFVGTSTGLYATDALSGGTTVWSKVGPELAKIGFAPCFSMRLRTSDNNFVVGTYGSGAFQLSVPVATLPIELTTFTGKAVNKTNVLSWETASETDNKGFDIERSADGSRFETIGFVAGNGTTSKAQSYNFEDNTPLSNSYYRLKQWDNDGRFELSKVIQITQKSIAKLNVYPNPVSNVLTIETDLKGDYQIFNLLGQQVLTGKTPPSGAGGLDVSTLSKGTYIIRVGVQQVKFVKQ